MTATPARLAAMPMREWTLVPGSVGSLTVRPMTAGPSGPIDHYLLSAPTRECPVWRAWIPDTDRLHVLSPVAPPMGRWIERGALTDRTDIIAARRWLIGQDRDGGLQL